MGTKAVIARADPADRQRWNGIYVHKNGHPAYCGKYLFTQVITRFKGDLEAAAEHFIDHHPAGWSVLDEAFGRNECYCHDKGGKNELAARFDETSARNMEWTYVLRPEGLEIRRGDRGVVELVPWDQERTDWQEITERGERRAA